MAKKQPPIFAKGMTLEEANAYIANVIERNKRTPASQPVFRWSEEDTLLRHQIIIHYLGTGVPRIVLVRTLMNDWNASRSRVQVFIKEALKYLSEATDEYRDSMRETQLNKLDNFIAMCIAQGKMKEAAMGLDQINKITGIYDNTKKVDVTTEGGPIRFDFGK